MRARSPHRVVTRSFARVIDGDPSAASSPAASPHAHASSRAASKLSAAGSSALSRRSVRDDAPSSCEAGSTAPPAAGGSAPAAPCGARRQPALVPAQVPAVYLINHFVFHGYKEFGLSTRECVRSIFHINNETVNVWTSLLIAADAALWTVAVLLTTDRDAYFCCVLLFATACRVACWLLSAAAHALSTHASPYVVAAAWRNDYIGIYLSIMGLCNAGTYIELSPHFPPAVWLSATLLGTAGCVASVAFMHSMGAAYNEERARALRTLPFVASLLVYVVPYGVKLALHGMDVYSAGFLLTIFFPLLGGAFFVSLWPERAWPASAWVHTWALSHHWWHWANVAGNTAFYTSVWRARKLALDSAGAPPAVLL
jgi:adiponectin receptor